nr:GNAT family N-acetyltransferase [uncultured Pseudodesulfovibrio sp.]
MQNVLIHSYRPGMIGEIVHFHGSYYSKHWGFEGCFEAEVAEELGAFVRDYDERRDGLWCAEVDDCFAGAIAVDGSRFGRRQARVRWFIVPEEFQSNGVGSQLFEQAMKFCEVGRFELVHLWTFKGLDAARKLYERNGFALVEEASHCEWGPEITAQKFELSLTR